MKNNKLFYFTLFLVLQCLFFYFYFTLNDYDFIRVILPKGSANSTESFELGNLVISEASKTFAKKKLAVIVPMRNRMEELLVMAPALDKFLNRQQIPHHIFGIQQADGYRFNRASLLNVGFLYVMDKFDYIVMHDVDLVPLNENLKYDYPASGIMHIVAPGLHPLYDYEGLFGGILIVTVEIFAKLNGMLNEYWGWGREDDEFYAQVNRYGIKFERPQNITTGKYDTFMHIHDDRVRYRDKQQCYGQEGYSYERYNGSGVFHTKYKTDKVEEHVFDGTKITLVDVELECNKNVTPWCWC